MNEDSQFREALRALILDAAEHASYLGELGVNRVESQIEDIPVAPAAVVKASVNSYIEPGSVVSSALERNARAEATASSPVETSLSNKIEE